MMDSFLYIHVHQLVMLMFKVLISTLLFEVHAMGYVFQIQELKLAGHILNLCGELEVEKVYMQTHLTYPYDKVEKITYYCKTAHMSLKK